MPGSECLNPDIDENSGNPLHKYKIVIDSQTSGHSDVEVFRMVGNSDWKTIIEKVNILDFNEQAPVPTNFYFPLPAQPVDQRMCMKLIILRFVQPIPVKSVSWSTISVLCMMAAA